MSSSTIPISISSLFLCFLMPNIIVTSATNNPMIEKACSTPRLSSKMKLCIQVLRSQPNIASAANLFDISIAIMKSGILSATSTRAYVEKLLTRFEDSPGLKAALQECKSSYDAVIVSFAGAMNEVRNKDYKIATYDLLVGSTDNITRCLKNVVSGEIEDSTIWNGNNVVQIYGLSAYQTVDSLLHESNVLE